MTKLEKMLEYETQTEQDIEIFLNCLVDLLKHTKVNPEALANAGALV